MTLNITLGADTGNPSRTITLLTIGVNDHSRENLGNWVEDAARRAGK